MPSIETSSTRTSPARSSAVTAGSTAGSAMGASCARVAALSAMVAPLRRGYGLYSSQSAECRQASVPHRAAGRLGAPAGRGPRHRRGRRPGMASTRTWFETVAEAQRRASRRLPRSVYLAVLAGTEAGVTMHDNVRAFSELRFRPHVAGLPAARELATTVMGVQVSLPVLLSPTGVQAVHPDGEIAVARAAAAAGTAMGLSSFASKPVEEVGKATDKLFFQCYWAGSRDEILARAERARAAGASGLIITLDWVFGHRRDWGSPWIPERLDFRALLRHVPQVAVRPGYLARWLRSGSLPGLGVPNSAARGAPVPTFFGAYGQWLGSAPVTWADLAWLRQRWDGPFMVKGITRPDDARRAADIG